MKKQYISPKMTVEQLNTADILTSSTTPIADTTPVEVQERKETTVVSEWATD